MKSKVQLKLEATITKVINKVMGSGLVQDENTADGARYITPGMPEQLRALASEGIVLLKNENGALPIRKEEKIAVFGRIQHDWFYVGYGSGGDVHPPYEVKLLEAFDEAGVNYHKGLAGTYRTWCEKNQPDHGYWGHWPFSHEEMPVSEALAARAAKISRTALVIIGRAAGEDRENKLEEGSYYLTATEREMLANVTKAFEKTIVVLDCGNVIDMSWVDEYEIDAIVYAWQLGQENAHALTDVLTGAVNPSGRLSDTIAKTYEDIPSSAHFGAKEGNDYVEDIYVGYRYYETFAPEDIRYPFGFGLSYTTFEKQLVHVDTNFSTGTVTLDLAVTNIGESAGKDVIELYIAPPAGALGKPAKVLAAYEKTKLLAPGERQIVRLALREKDYASFDESGKTGYRSAFVLEAGAYRVLLGEDSSHTEEIHTICVPQTRCIEQLSEICIPDSAKPYAVLDPAGSARAAVAKNGKEFPASIRADGTRDLVRRVTENLPKEIMKTGDLGIKLSDVKSGKYTLEQFIAQLSDRELCDLTRGQGFMGSPLGTDGNAGAFGGITEELRAKGIPAIITADGPAGLRVRRYTSLLPCGTAIACTWNRELVEETFVKIGEEAVHFGIDVNLAPGMNIHRNPLCGRNFEYYSEDPMLSGLSAAATVRGLQKGGISACPKHFACNNQEYNRNHNDSRVSMRALREIYLKNFEYCVKEGNPKNLMTSYNKINGVWAHYNYDLVTTVLRKEWGYEGCVMTDWWMRMDRMPEFPKIRNNAYRTRAQVDVLMPGSLSPATRKYVYDKKHLESLGAEGGITRAELQRSAANVLRYAMTLERV